MPRAVIRLAFSLETWHFQTFNSWASALLDAHQMLALGHTPMAIFRYFAATPEYVKYTLG